MPQPSRTQTILIVVVALLVVAVIAAVSYRLGQATPSHQPVAHRHPDDNHPPGPRHPQHRDRRRLDPPPGLPQGPAGAGDGGSMTGPAGLPLGYTHDRDRRRQRRHQLPDVDELAQDHRQDAPPTPWPPPPPPTNAPGARHDRVLRRRCGPD